MKTILVATDYSSPANNAVEYAAHLAKDAGTELILFNVYKLSIHASNSMASSSNVEHLKEQNEIHLSELAKDISDRFEINVSWEVGKDDTVESLKVYTQNNPVDLVVMGIESNLTEYKLFGNTTTAAIKLMQFPLLVVPNDIHFEGIHKIMYACEASFLKEDCELDILKQFIHVNSAQVDVLHVITDNSEKEKDEKMERLIDVILSDVDHQYRYVKNSKVGDGIISALEQYPADLLVMIPHKLRFIEFLTKGSQTSQMTVKTRVPLLVIPNVKC